MRKTETSQTTTTTTDTTSSGSEPLVSSYDKVLPPPPCEADPSRMDYVNVDLDKMSSAFPAVDSMLPPATEVGQTVIKRSRESKGGAAKDEGEGAERGGGDSRGGDEMTTSAKRESIYANATMIAGTHVQHECS